MTFAKVGMLGNASSPAMLLKSVLKALGDVALMGFLQVSGAAGNKFESQFVVKQALKRLTLLLSPRQISNIWDPGIGDRSLFYSLW